MANASANDASFASSPNENLNALKQLEKVSVQPASRRLDAKNLRLQLQKLVDLHTEERKYKRTFADVVFQHHGAQRTRATQRDRLRSMLPQDSNPSIVDNMLNM